MSFISELPTATSAHVSERFQVDTHTKAPAEQTMMEKTEQLNTMISNNWKIVRLCSVWFAAGSSEV